MYLDLLWLKVSLTHTSYKGEARQLSLRAAGP